MKFQNVEERTIQVYSNQTLGEAISNGEQWTEKAEIEDDHFSFAAAA